MKDTKDYILMTSLKLFMQKSFKEVTMKEIVEKTSLSKGAFYHYFASKEAVFEEVVKYFYSHIIVTDYSNFPQTSLKDFCKVYLDKLANSPYDIEDAGNETNLFGFISEAIRKIPSFMDIHKAQRKTEIDAWSNIVAIAKKNKEIKANFPNKDISAMFLNISDGIVLNKMSTSDEEESLKGIKKGWGHLYKLLQKE
ncbi:MAG: putative HTH-type transcriptional regulator YfiR [Candidatus Ordinivivax streblomastigis]|uniref:Putative HTH-type transcriptional regulator YfiR n=1 Tax=Candidatus Ordinivivax streblomastigis TaxID=2540710 RepID=A0A5M8NWV1_9BACT|nr:MAG: putative HTH-type transcriptional regulator YfiR [Candidatus Ordinivivax streblomastigis]